MLFLKINYLREKLFYKIIFIFKNKRKTAHRINKEGLSICIEYNNFKYV